MPSLKTKHHVKKNVLSDDVDEIKAAIQDAISDVKNKIGEIFTDHLDNIKDQSSLLRNNLTDYTEKKPIQSLGVALLAGLILGFFLQK